MNPFHKVKCRDTFNFTSIGNYYLRFLEIFSKKISVILKIVFARRFLCDKVVPGNKVVILGIFSIRKITASKVRSSCRVILLCESHVARRKIAKQFLENIRENQF